MITITKFQVSIDRQTIELEITADLSSTVSAITVADQKQYLTNTSTNLSARITELNANKAITIQASELGVSILDGIYFLTLTDSIDSSNKTSVTTNLSQYFYCINDLLALANTDCVECNDGIKNVLTADLFLEGLKAALYLGRYTEAINHFTQLNKICIIRCDSCSAVSGTFGTLNGEFVIA